MAVVQTTYPNFKTDQVAGQVKNTQTCDVDSMNQAGATAVPFGRAVMPFVGGNDADRDVQLGAGRPQVALLDAALNDSSTSLSFDGARDGGFRVGQYVLVDNEAIHVTAVAANLTVIRGALGTTAAAHADDAPVLAFDEILYSGIAIMDERLPAADGVTFGQGEIMPVLHRGDVVVQVSASVFAGDQVVVTTRSATNDPLGVFSSRTVGPRHVAVPNARFRSSTTTTGATRGLAVVRFAGTIPSYA